MILALVFCALGVFLTVAAIGRITAASRPPASPHRAETPADDATADLRGARS